MVLQYFSIARTLPDVAELRQKASQFETTRILDRNGNVLYEILDPNAGRRTYVPLNKISPYLVAATIATEDKDFYSHPGFDPLAIIARLLAELHHRRDRLGRLHHHPAAGAHAAAVAPRSAPSAPTSAKRARSSWRPKSPAAIPRMRSSSCI